MTGMNKEELDTFFRNLANTPQSEERWYSVSHLYKKLGKDADCDLGAIDSVGAKIKLGKLLNEIIEGNSTFETVVQKKTTSGRKSIYRFGKKRKNDTINDCWNCNSSRYKGSALYCHKNPPETVGGWPKLWELVTKEVHSEDMWCGAHSARENGMRLNRTGVLVKDSMEWLCETKKGDEVGLHHFDAKGPAARAHAHQNGAPVKTCDEDEVAKTLQLSFRSDPDLEKEIQLNSFTCNDVVFVQKSKNLWLVGWMERQGEKPADTQIRIKDTCTKMVQQVKTYKDVCVPCPTCNGMIGFEDRDNASSEGLEFCSVGCARDYELPDDEDGEDQDRTQCEAKPIGQPLIDFNDWTAEQLAEYAETGDIPPGMYLPDAIKYQSEGIHYHDERIIKPKEETPIPYYIRFIQETEREKQAVKAWDDRMKRQELWPGESQGSAPPVSNSCIVVDDPVAFEETRPDSVKEAARRAVVTPEEVQRPICEGVGQKAIVDADYLAVMGKFPGDESPNNGDSKHECSRCEDPKVPLVCFNCAVEMGCSGCCGIGMKCVHCLEGWSSLKQGVNPMDLLVCPDCDEGKDEDGYTCVTCGGTARVLPAAD